MKPVSRRGALRAGGVIGAGLASGGLTATRRAEAMSKQGGIGLDGEYTFGHTSLFMDQYYDGTIEILSGIRGDFDQIGDLTNRAVKVLKNGGTVWTSMNIGHMPFYEQADGRRGNPRVLRHHVKNPLKLEHENVRWDMLKSGDMVFTNYCSRDVKAARDRGVYVVSVTVNYTNNEFRPADFANPNEDNLLLSDVSNEILHSHVPYNQGLVQAPEIPEMTICPSTVTGSGAIHWILSAEISEKLERSNAPNISVGEQYLDILTERIERVREHRDAIRATAVEMTRRIRDGGRWFARSLEHPGFQSELTGVASGPMIVNWGDWEKTKDRNVMLIGAISPAYQEEIALAREKKAEGAYVIGVGPASLDGDVPSERLIDSADSGFDNFSPESGGVIADPKSGSQICPTSGIVGDVIQQMICAQWTDEMVRRGSVPYYWMGFFQNGGRPYDDGIRMFFERQGF